MKRVIFKNCRGIMDLPLCDYFVEIRNSSEIFLGFFVYKCPFEVSLGYYSSMEEAKTKILEFNRFLSNPDIDEFYF